MKISLKAMGGLESEVGFSEKEVQWITERSLAELLGEFNIAKDIMVSVNDRMILKDDFATFTLNDGDVLKLLPPIAAG